MLYPALTEATVVPKNKLEEDLWSCSVEKDAYIVAYVSKMFAMPRSRLPPPLKGADVPAVVANTGLSSISSEGHLASTPVTAVAPSDPTVNTPESGADVKFNEEKTSDLANDDEALIGFARLYSGTLTVGQTLFCLLPKYSPTFPPTHPRNAAHITPVTISALYEMMGRDLVSVQEVKAGNVFAVGGLEGTVWRNATLCGLGGNGNDDTGKGVSTSTEDCLVNLAGVNNQVRIQLFHFIRTQRGSTQGRSRIYPSGGPNCSSCVRTRGTWWVSH
jgi:ribosome assembly protein 1